MPSVHSKKRSHGDESDISDKSTEVSQLKKKHTDNTESVGADHHLKKRSKALEEDDDEETKGSKAHKKGLKIPSDTADEQAAKQKKAQDIYENIPVKVTGKKMSPIESFADCNLVPQIMNSINTAGYTKPTPVQKYALPIILEGDDLMASAQTGSGKTAAFLVPFIQKFLLNKKLPQTFRLPDARGWRRDGIEMPLALILAPTRELALQINQEAQKFVRGTLIKSAVVYGGASYVEQCKQMERGCHIVIATPGRLQDFVDRGKLSLEQIQFLCLDEADRMLDMGFEPQIRSIVEGANMPPRKNRQTVMFSATFPKAIQKLAADFLRDDNVLLEVGRSGSTTELITQVVKFMQEDEKMAALLETLTKDAGLTLVFVNQKRTADTIARAFVQEQALSRGHSR
jgi:ATP-dependent RNA helicase DDX3X